MGKDRVCVIGAGPSGMSVMYHHSKLGTENRPEVVCYEKQSEWGGLWNFSWKTGTDEFGEVCHNSMYRHLWINAPKECLEMADYTFKKHFGRPMPSFLPRQPIKDYMEGRWKNLGMDIQNTNIHYNHVVRFVKYNQASQDFTVRVSDLRTAKTKEETFSHVIVATGIFSTPNKPEFPGIDKFHGRILHSHDFREAEEFKGQNVLVIGGSYSAEDIAVQSMKYGAKSATISYRNTLPGYTWPEGVHERPGIKQFLENSVVFDDERQAEIDIIVLCTGYLCSFPFLEENLKLVSNTSFYPGNLYKGVVWTEGGGNKLFYIGVQNQVWALPMFDVQAEFVWKFLTGQLSNEPRSYKEMENDIQKWLLKLSDIASRPDAVNFQADYLEELIQLMKRKDKLARDVWMAWIKDREENIGTFRDRCYASVYTGQVALKIKPWMKNYDEDIKHLN